MAQRLAEYEPGVVPGQCAACGAYDEAEWSVTIVRDRTADMRASWRLCETCYRMVVTLLMNPERERENLRGYR